MLLDWQNRIGMQFFIHDFLLNDFIIQVAKALKVQLIHTHRMTNDFFFYLNSAATTSFDFSTHEFMVPKKEIGPGPEEIPKWEKSAVFLIQTSFVLSNLHKIYQLISMQCPLSFIYLSKIHTFYAYAHSLFYSGVLNGSFSKSDTMKSKLSNSKFHDM